MEHKDNKKLFIIVGCLLLVMGISLAYFVGRTLFNGNGSSGSGTTATINGAEVNVEGKLTFNDLDILPGHKNVSSIKVTATGNNELIPFNLIWNGTNTLNTPLNFTVYKSDSEINVSTTCERKTKVENGLQLLNEECTITNIDSLGSIVSSGTINKAETTTKVTLAPDEFITTTTTGNTIYYYVILEYPNLNESQNIDMGGSFDGVVTVEASNATADINITAIYQEGEDGNYKEITSIPNKEAGYVLNGENSTCTNNAKPTWNKEDWSLEVNTLTTSGTDCSLYFEKYIEPSKKTLDMLGLTATEGPTSFNGVEKTNGYLYSSVDNYGTSYYFRGKINNNWVQFAGFYWRIIRINGNGSIRMIYNGTSTTTTGTGTQIGTKAFNSTYNSAEYVGIKYTIGSQHGDSTNSTILGTSNSTDTTTLNGWYNNYIKDSIYEKYIDENTGFCSEREVASGHSNFTGPGYGSQNVMFLSSDRIYTTNLSEAKNAVSPKLNCENLVDILRVPIGLITADEVIFAGGFIPSGTIDNEDYYLYNGQSYWTMTPYAFTGGSYAGLYNLANNGNIQQYIANGEYGVRPVINLSSDVKLTGNGTTYDPYKIEGME